MTETREDLYDSNMTLRPASPTRIASWGLFGESAQLPELLHCETIAARSVLHEWEFEAHRHARLHQLLLIEKGGGVVRLEQGSATLRPGALVSVPPGEVHGFRFDPGTQGHVCTVAEELRDELLTHAGDLRPVLGQACVLAAGAATAATLRQVAAEYAGGAPGRALRLRGLCASLFALVARQAAAQSTPRQAPSAASELMRRFESLIEAHYLEHWSVADYARALAVTPTHLSRVARAAAGESASRLIDARVVREARRNLAFTHLSVTTIAYSLGFSDPAYFSRVFTRALGLSPRAFRARVTA